MTIHTPITAARYSAKRPFVATHQRVRDGLRAMFIASTADDGVLYRVEWTENGRKHENTLIRPASKFREQYGRKLP